MKARKHTFALWIFGRLSGSAVLLQPKNQIIFFKHLVSNLFCHTLKPSLTAKGFLGRIGNKIYIKQCASLNNVLKFTFFY